MLSYSIFLKSNVDTDKYVVKKEEKWGKEKSDII